MSSEPSPPPPPVTREELVSLLFEAAELEHGLCCSYLYAAFTLKEPGAPGFDAEQSEAVGRWRQLVNSVAHEEMLHLSLVSNLLTAVGAPPHLRRPAFPQRSRYYPPGITVELLGFSDATLTRFLYIERPEGVDLGEIDPALESKLAEAADELPTAAGALQTAAEEADDDAEQDDYLTVGHLYAAIEDGLTALTDRLGEAAVFLGPDQAQATPESAAFSELRPVVDLASARAALALLIEQGEGTKGDWRNAHYGRFHGVREELRRLRGDDPGFEPAHPALANPSVTEEGSGTLVDDPTTAKVMELGNGCYQTMTHILVRFLGHSGESEASLGALIGAAIDCMEHVLAPLGRLLATLPAGPSHGSATAGLGFELYRSVALSPHRAAVWSVLGERLCELADFADRLLAEGGPDELQPVAGSLRDIATSLAEAAGPPPAG